MSRGWTIALFCALLLAPVAATPPARALDADLRSPFFERSQRPARQAPAQRQPRYREAPAPAPAPQGGLFRNLFGGGPSAAPAVQPGQQPYYRRALPSEADRPAGYRRVMRNPSRDANPRRRTGAATAAREEAPRAKAAAATTILVMGDSLATSLAQGIDTALSDNPDVAVARKSKSDAGLVRTETFDLFKTAQELLAARDAGKEKADIAVFMLGVNDRQPIKDGETTHEPGSEAWNQAYSARVSDLLKPFADNKIPIVWVGLPPMRNEKLSADMVAMNTLDRAVVERRGGVFVDVWEGFVDADNRYSSYGPDVSGEMTKLRANDGIQFTRAGARKVAHFVDVEIKRLLEQRRPAAGAGGLPLKPTTAPDGALSPEKLIDSQVSALPEPSGSISPPPKPVAGPVLPLTGAPSASGGTLLGAAPPKAMPGDASMLIERVYGEGRQPEPKAGRADDFRWPRQGS